MKLFEIPVYVLSRALLEKRVNTAFSKFFKKYNDTGKSETELKKLFDITAYPARLWDYNHIIGYIVISKCGGDMILDWYTLFPGVQKYYWGSGRKKYMQNTHLSGYHFYTGNIKSGTQLRQRLYELIKGFEKELKKRGYFVDLEAFRNIDGLLDYEKLLGG